MKRESNAPSLVSFTVKKDLNLSNLQRMFIKNIDFQYKVQKFFNNQASFWSLKKGLFCVKSQNVFFNLRSSLECNAISETAGRKASVG